MFSRKGKMKIESVPLEANIAEARALAHSRQSKRFSAQGNIASARYHAELASFIYKNRIEPTPKQRKAIFQRSRTAPSAPFNKGKGKGYDVYPPSEGGPAILKGVAIVKGPDKWSMRFSSMEEAIRYVRVNNIGDLPVRVHKKP